MGAEYRYTSGDACHGHDYLVPAVAPLVETALDGQPRRLFDLGCGNGAFAAALAVNGIDVTGVDQSVSGIQEGQRAFPNLRLEVGSGYDDLASRFGRFPVVICLEVIEHVYDPRSFARTIFNLLEPGGTAIISTPFHGYWKNLALAVTNRFDFHLDPLWDHGHIKFWSEATLAKLIAETGFVSCRFERVGRSRAFAKSAIAIVRAPI